MVDSLAPSAPRRPLPAPLRLVALATLGAACATFAPAPATRYSLGSTHADYRDYSRPGQSICDAETRWLSEELGSVNTLLARFLETTDEQAAAAADGGAQTEARLAVLEEASRTLAPVVQVHRRNLQELGACSFRKSGLFPALLERGNALVPRSEERLAQAPTLLAAAALQRVREQWVLEAPQREATARQTWCPPKPVVGTTDLFFARRSLDGRTEWLFCDGHRVEQLPGGEPTLHAPEGLSRQAQRRVQPAKYLRSAQAFPAAEMDVPPTAVPTPAAAGSAPQKP